MIPSKYLSGIVTIAAIVWAIALICEGGSLSGEMMKPLSTVTGVMGLLWLAFDRWLWRMPLLHPWLVEAPNIRGTWRVELKSNWIDPETGENNRSNLMLHDYKANVH